jgi:arylsulfatase A-like enzyme
LLTERLATETLHLLETFKAEGRPFFLAHSFYEVHMPLQALPPVIAKYSAKAQLGLREAFTEEPQYDLSAKGPRLVGTVQSHATYAAMVEEMDTAAGRILRKLDELGLADNTLLIFTVVSRNRRNIPLRQARRRRAVVALKHRR